MARHLLFLMLGVGLFATPAAAQLGWFNEVPVPTAPAPFEVGPGAYSPDRKVFVRHTQQGIHFTFGANTVVQLQVRTRRVLPNGQLEPWSGWTTLHGSGSGGIGSFTWSPLPFAGPGAYDVDLNVYGTRDSRTHRFQVVVVPPAQRALQADELNTYDPRTGTTGTLRHTILIWHGPQGSTELDRPILVVEGIDAANVNGPEAYYALGASGDAPLFPLGQVEGADIAILDFGDGGRRMQDNAAVVRSAIARMRSASRDRSRSLDVIGVSMGGVVARYALAQMEQDGALYGVDRFVSVDAPQQGAIIERALQDEIRARLQPQDWPVGLARPAGRQLLRYNAFDNRTVTNPSQTDHRLFYAELRALNGGVGYPTRTTNVGVSFGTPAPNPGTLLPPVTIYNPNARWGRLDLDHLLSIFVGGWNYFVVAGGETGEPGSYLPRDITQVAGRTSVTILNTGVHYPVSYEFIRYEPTHPTFIPYASALDLTNGVSRFDPPLIALAAGSIPSFHDIVPTDLVPPLLRRLGYNLPPPPSVTISGPSSLAPGQYGRWRASTPDPGAGYQYNWQYRIIFPNGCSGGGGPVVMGMPEGEPLPGGTSAPQAPGPGGDPEPNAIPCGVWHDGDGSGAIFIRRESSSVRLELRVRASNSAGASVWSATRSVCVGACNGFVPESPEDAGSAAKATGGAWETAILSVHPNPLRSGEGAAVAFSTAAAGATSLRLFDALGREVAQLRRGDLSEGLHAAVLPSGLPAGAYVVRLEAGGQVATRVVTILR